MEDESQRSTTVDYLDFELQIGQGRGRRYPVTVVQSAAGEAHEDMRFPFTDTALEIHLLTLQNALLRSGGKRRRIPLPEEQTVQRFGKALFEALFRGEVRSCYAVSQREAAAQGKGLRVKLRIQSPQLAALPWEFLYDPEQAEYVCLSRNTPLVRYLELPRPPQPLTVRLPFHILGMIAGPSNLGDLDAEGEQKRVEQALEPLMKRRAVQLTWLKGQTWEDLQRAMRQGPWHVFHFIGHGGFDQAADEGVIALSDEEGQANLLSATQVGRLLTDHRSLRLVVLNACEGARGGKRDIFSSTAARLVQRGVPAVLAMQYEITNPAAIELSRAFYEAVAEGMPIDAAIAEARKAVSFRIDNTLEWGIPALYLRSPDGVLFHVKPEPPASSDRPVLSTREKSSSHTPEPSLAQPPTKERLPSSLGKRASTTFGRMTVFPIMPSRISRLYELAYNLWWSWHPEALALYKELDPKLWEEAEHNPVRFLTEVQPELLQQAVNNATYLEHYDSVLRDFDHYMHPRTETWFSQHYPELANQTITYFSAEFGLHEALPIYAGDLGILSGDHCKEASDLGLPFVGVGFFYPQGYFRQSVTREGVQEAFYDKLLFSEAPVIPACDPNGNEILIQVELPGRRIHAKIWKLQVGRIPLYLMDTDVALNAPNDRELSARLYGGDREIRISQEIVLGIGGVRALRALGISPSAWHINDGHAAFLNLERCRELVVSGLSFNEAREAVAANSLFTTHTPVPAGNDTFSFDLIDKYFSSYWRQLRLTRDQFMDVAREDHGWGPSYGMTVLALRLTGQHNGVSALHGAVSRDMWQFLWPDVDVDEVPIDFITNGVHTPSWITPELNSLFKRYLGEDWEEHVDEPDLWNAIVDLPDKELWRIHLQRKEAFIGYARRHLRRHHLRLGEGSIQIAEIKHMLNPDALIIGFARHFATYKRATLIFRDPERLRRILNNPERPVQIIFAGKAHPADGPGKSLIEQVYRFSQSNEFRGKIVFLENYDIDMARYLVSGTDLWLNNPIRPHEASGTSGQKAALNGQPNCSILDGWWAEGFDGRNGWAIGEGREYHDPDIRDEADSLSLYSILEEEIIPTYYDRGVDGIPHAWIAFMKEAIRTCVPAFSMRRMVKEYTQRFYVPEILHSKEIEKDNYAQARALVAWKDKLKLAWPGLQLFVEGQREGQLSLGQGFEVRAWFKSDTLTPDDLCIELIYGEAIDDKFIRKHAVPMSYSKREQDGSYRYDIHVKPTESGSFAYYVRVVPYYSGLMEKYEMGLTKRA